MTGVGFVDCKNALVETNGDIDKAVDTLRKKGLAKAQKKASRETKEGLIFSYIHAGGRIGVLLELNCETDFVARTDEFHELAKNISMHIAASNPLYIKREFVPVEVIAKEKEIYKEQLISMDKPQAVKEKIVEGKIEKYFQEVCLSEQPFIKDPSKNISSIINQEIAKLGENIAVKRYARFQLGE
jgi:elongation factor Ts